MFNLPDGEGLLEAGGHHLRARPDPRESCRVRAGEIADITPLPHCHQIVISQSRRPAWEPTSVGAERLLQLPHVGDGEVSVLQPRPVQEMVAGLLSLVSVVSQVVQISE